MGRRQARRGRFGGRKPRQRVGEFSENPSIAARLMLLGEPLPPSCKTYELDDLVAFVNEEPKGWHLSISAPSRYPTWDEIAAARYQLLPDDRLFVMHLPPSLGYHNIEGPGPRAGNIFHLWEHPPREEPKR